MYSYYYCDYVCVEAGLGNVHCFGGMQIPQGGQRNWTYRQM